MGRKTHFSCQNIEILRSVAVESSGFHLRYFDPLIKRKFDQSGSTCLNNFVHGCGFSSDVVPAKAISVGFFCVSEMGTALFCSDGNRLENVRTRNFAPYFAKARMHLYRKKKSDKDIYGNMLKKQLTSIRPSPHLPWNN